MKKLLFTLLICLIPTHIHAQPNIEQWQFYDGGGEIEYFKDIYALEDGGYFAVGITAGYSWLVKLDEFCNIDWQVIGDTTATELTSVIEADNGDAVMAGLNRGQNYTFSFLLTSALIS